jgi:hypothetical protein
VDEIRFAYTRARFTITLPFVLYPFNCGEGFVTTVANILMAHEDGSALMWWLAIESLVKPGPR